MEHHLGSSFLGSSFFGSSFFAYSFLVYSTFFFCFFCSALSIDVFSQWHNYIQKSQYGLVFDLIVGFELGQVDREACDGNGSTLQ